MASGALVTAVADEHAAAERAAEVLATALDAARTVHGAGHASLSGGSMGRVYALLGDRLSDWSDIHFWFSDERCVPPDHEESIFRLVQETLVAPGAEIHRAPGELGPEEAARRYAEELDDVVLDVALLGMGPDGHTASLFPGHPALRAEGITAPRARLAQAAARAHHAHAPLPQQLPAHPPRRRGGLQGRRARARDRGARRADPASLLDRDRLEIVADEAALGAAAGPG